MHPFSLRHTLILAIIFTSSPSASAFLQSNDNRNTNNTSSRAQHSNQYEHHYRATGSCGTEQPSAALIEVHKQLSSLPATGRVADNINVERIEVDTYFHVVSTSAQVNLVTNAMLAAQFVYLQQSYENTSIHYNLLGIDRSINDTWARNEDSLGMKRALRRGTYRTLNVYFQTDLAVSDSSRSGSSRTIPTSFSTRGKEDVQGYNSNIRRAADQPNLLGFCTLPNPKITASSSLDSYIDDGCNILASTMPGGSITHYNRGGTTVHEVGHWHGLLHTFQDQSCSPDSKGDYIADTPQQSIPTEGCPATGTQDSCPQLEGLDLVNNFMDYSSDDCYQSFTRDQAGRMRRMWATMREGK